MNVNPFQNRTSFVDIKLSNVNEPKEKETLINQLTRVFREIFCLKPRENVAVKKIGAKISAKVTNEIAFMKECGYELRKQWTPKIDDLLPPAKNELPKFFREIFCLKPRENVAVKKIGAKISAEVTNEIALMKDSGYELRKQWIPKIGDLFHRSKEELLYSSEVKKQIVSKKNWFQNIKNNASGRAWVPSFNLSLPEKLEAITIRNLPKKNVFDEITQMGINSTFKPFDRKNIKKKNFEIQFESVYRNIDVLEV